MLLIRDLLNQDEEQLELFGNGESQKKNLIQLEKAKQEAESGTYGRCQICQNLIGVDDLLVYHHATTCHKCGFEYNLFPWVTNPQESS